MDTAKLCVVASYAAGLSIEVDQLPRPEETRIGRGFVLGPGGKGSNQAIQAARLGADVALVACVGDDLYGREALRLWDEEGIPTDHVARTSQHQTGVALILVEDSGRNLIAIDPGANHALEPRLLDDAAPAFECSSVCLVQLEIPLASASYALKAAKEAGCLTIFNPAPAQPVPEHVWPYVDIVTPNKGEAEVVSRLKGTEEEIGRKLADKVNVAAIVTLGEEGAFVVDKAGRMERVPAAEVAAVDTTGAGDAFNGALAVRIAEGSDVIDAVRWGTAAGGLACTAHGVVPALARRESLTGLLERMCGRPGTQSTLPMRDGGSEV
jgi:ribokinase